MELSGKHILLTGATGGIGQAIAMRLAQSGAKLLLVSRDETKLNELRESLFAQKAAKISSQTSLSGTLANSSSVLEQNTIQKLVTHRILAVDLTTSDGLLQLKEVAEELKQKDERIDIVINNAGCNQFSFLARRSAVSIEHEIRLNLLTPILISQSALNWLNKPGLILNIGSTFGSIGYPGYSTYCASKAGLHRFSESLAREIAGSGIKVLYLAPRATETQLNTHAVVAMNKELGNKSDSPEIVAKSVEQILRDEKSSRWLGWPEKFFAKLNQVFPNLVSNSIIKQLPIIHKHLTKN